MLFWLGVVWLVLWWFGWVLGAGHVRNWGYAEPGVRVYMYYERLTVSLFWCVGVWLVTVCGGLPRRVVLYGCPCREGGGRKEDSCFLGI